MFELADYLSGIYKVEDCTKSVTIQNVVSNQMLTSTQSTQQNENDGRPLSQTFDKLRATQERVPVLEDGMQMDEGVEETIDGGLIDDTAENTAIDTTIDETIDGGTLDSTEDAANDTVVETGNRRTYNSTGDEDMLNMDAAPIVVSVSAEIHAPPEADDNDIDIDR